MQVLHCPIFGINGAIVGYIIFMIRGRGVNRRQPYTINIQVNQILEFGNDALYITNAITVAVSERTNEYLVTDQIRKGFGAPKISFKIIVMNAIFVKIT